MALEKGSRLVSAKSRKAVQEVLAIVSSPETVLGKIGDCLMRLDAVAEEAVPALAEALDEKKGNERILAAWFLVNIAGSRPDMVREAGLAERAEKALVAALESDEEAQRLFALTFLSLGVVPGSVGHVLRKLLAHKIEKIHVTAAAAFLGGNCVGNEDATIGRSDARAILMRTLHGHNEWLVAIAARALLRQSLDERLAMQELMEAFDKLPALGKYHILQGLEQVGENAHGASAAVMALILDKGLPSALRRQAAETLGKIAAGNNTSVDVLFDALSCRDGQVVLGAVDGLIALGKSGQRVAGKMATLLSADNENLRAAACLGLKAMGQQALGALPTLIERLGDESNLEICNAMIEAITAIGSAAIPALMDVIRQGDARRIRWAGVALVRMGKAAAPHLAEALGEKCDTPTRYAYVMLLRDMGWDAAPAVPVLGRILDETDDEELAYLATAAIFVCGQAGAPAVPALVRGLMNRGDETASAAERSLKLIGVPAITALKEASKSAEGTAKRRIEEALRYFRPGEEQRFPHLERIGRDDLLRLFVLVGTFLEKEKKAGWRKIAKVIGPQIDFKRIDGSQFGVTANTISSSVKMLSVLLKLKRPLTDNSEYRKGGLTREGSNLLKQAKEYLRRKYGNSTSSPDSD